MRSDGSWSFQPCDEGCREREARLVQEDECAQLCACAEGPCCPTRPRISYRVPTVMRARHLWQARHAMPENRQWFSRGAAGGRPSEYADTQARPT